MDLQLILSLSQKDHATGDIQSRCPSRTFPFPSTKHASNNLFQILCAILNRYYNFTGGFGDLSYLNWYAGETSTAVIVVNVPHLWPLISRILGLGSFRSNTPGIDSKNRFNNNRLSAVTRTQTKDFDLSGYIRSESEERIAGAGAWTGKVGRGENLEMGHVDATVEAGRRKTQDEEEGVWGVRGHSGSIGSEGIVKTVHMKQYAE